MGFCLCVSVGRVLAQAPTTLMPVAIAMDSAGRGAGGEAADDDDLAERLARALHTGRARSLRDLATLVDDETHGPRARAALTEALLLQRDLDPGSASRQTLLDFYYDNVDSLRYSELLGGYLVRPLERQPVRYELRGLDPQLRSDRSMHLRKYVLYTEQAITHRSAADLRDLAEKIADLQTIEGHAFLLSWRDSEASAILAQDLDGFLHYLRQLLRRPSPEVADALFDFEARGYLRAGSMAHYLSRLCNVPFRAHWTIEEQRGHYGDLLDSLGSLSRIREFGYETSVGFSHRHFREAVDYFGRIIARPNTPDYVQHNALLDLAATEHSRALFYVSTQFLAARRGRETAYPAVHYLYLLRKLTNLGVAVPDVNGAMVYHLDVGGDGVAWVNFARYWATRHEDYDYDEHRRAFVNRHDQTLETENLERLFRLLNSESAEVALDAYARLTRADHVEVQQLVYKYKDLLRATNAHVPTLKDGHLEHTAQLTAYCLQNRIEFEAKPQLRERLDSLLLPLSPPDRVALENRIVRECHLDDLTPIEYWAAIHQYDLEAGYSVGRVLDYGYSRHWDAILASDAQLRLFLKKAVLFSRMDGIGISDSYLSKFVSVDADARERIGALVRSESDQHIARSLKRLLAVDQAVDGGMSEVDDFLEGPSAFTREEVAELPTPTLEQLSELLWRKSEAAGAKARLLYTVYLKTHLRVEMVPDLMSLLIREDHPEMVSGLLSDIYHYSWDDDRQPQQTAWLQHWQRHNGSYRTWGEDFYKEQVERLRAEERVTGMDLNAILRSPFYRPRDRALVLASTGKLVSPRHLFMLKFAPALDWSERAILDELALKYKDLKDLDKLFPEADKAPLVEYTMTRASDLALDPVDFGKLVNELMRKPWIENLLDAPGFAYAKTFHAALETYLEESPYLSEYEEQNTTLHLTLLEFAGKSPLERLYASAELDIDPGARLRIQESVLARVTYGQLGEVAKVYPRLQGPGGDRPYNFLNRDFGLPIFDLTSSATVDTFVARHATLSPRELYLAYLEDFGLALTAKGGGLDYARIYEILNYDIVLPFIGGGGNRRDWYAYGVIRLLELEHDTRLGFHEKLNENQLFYSFTASKRARAWSAYLLEKGLVSAEELRLQPSFNTASAEQEDQ